MSLKQTEVCILDRIKVNGPLSATCLGTILRDRGLVKNTGRAHLQATPAINILLKLGYLKRSLVGMMVNAPQRYEITPKGVQLLAQYKLEEVIKT